MLLSEKYKDFMRSNDPVEFLEGTTFAGKTTVGIVKFMLKVAQSPKKLHVLSGLDLGTIEKNIINKDLGIVDVFGLEHIEYNASGRGEHSLPHIVYRINNSPADNKIIYVVGYDNQARWKKVLGGQYGCVFIDEINVAHMDYVREISMRNDYMIATLNPDDPRLPIYKEYIDHSRPYDRYREDYPSALLDMLSEPEKEGWRHWFFSFKDNIGVSEEKKEQIKSMVAPGTKQYQNKILGLRGRSEGVIFNLTKRSIVKKSWIKNEEQQGRIKWRLFSCGVDTSYSDRSKDKIAFIYIGITKNGELYRLDEFGINNSDLRDKGQDAVAPSDIPPLLHWFLDKNRDEWGMPDGVYIDSADSATNQEIAKYKRLYGSIYTFAPSYKKFKIIDRITLEQGWLAEAQDCAFIVDTCTNLIDEHNAYSWEEKSHKQKPEDDNDHFINANQYAWMPYRQHIRGG